MFIYLSYCLSLYPSIYLSVCLSVCLSISISISISMSMSISISISISTSICLSICKFENEAILRNFLNFWTWQHQKRSNSTRPPHLLNLTASKMKLFCETSSIFQVDNIKNEAILRDILQKWKVECTADGLVPMRLEIFPLHLSKVLCLPRKSDARSYEMLHLSRKIILANLKIWCSKMQPFSGNQRPDLLTSLMFCTAPATWNAPATQNHIWTFKSGPSMWCFYHFDLEMCFAPQQCALFRRLNFKKCSEPGVLYTFWLGNVLRATTACTFSSSQLTKVLRA